MERKGFASRRVVGGKCGKRRRSEGLPCTARGGSNRQRRSRSVFGPEEDLCLPLWTTTMRMALSRLPAKCRRERTTRFLPRSRSAFIFRLTSHRGAGSRRCLGDVDWEEVGNLIVGSYCLAAPKALAKQVALILSNMKAKGLSLATATTYRPTDGTPLPAL